ncbi:MAG: hypothetical protein ACR2MO_01530 [Acidimicrobiales bacterium]
MHNNIVEGEPGIFPDPIARLLVRLGRLARRKDAEPAPPPPPPPPPAGNRDGGTEAGGEGRAAPEA